MMIVLAVVARIDVVLVLESKLRRTFNTSAKEQVVAVRRLFVKPLALALHLLLQMIGKLTRKPYVYTTTRLLLV